MLWRDRDGPDAEVVISNTPIAVPGSVRELYPTTNLSVKLPAELTVAEPGNYELVLRIGPATAARLPLTVALVAGTSHDGSPG